MRVVSLIILCLILGCVEPPQKFDSLTRLPHQWEAPVVYIRLPYDMNTSGYDINLELVKELCKEFSIRVYDALDGQAFIPKFVICNPSLLPEKQSGVINLYLDDTVIVHRTQTIMGSDPPDHPGYCYVKMPSSLLDLESAANAITHEWFHAFLGLGDEYRKPNTSGNVRTTDCPKEPYSPAGIATRACIMDHDETRRELCLPKYHNPDTDQGKESCYEQVARVLAQHCLANITVPENTIIGPFNPPAPVIEVRLK